MLRLSLFSLCIVLFAGCLGTSHLVGLPGGPERAAWNVWELKCLVGAGTASPVLSAPMDSGEFLVLFLTCKHVLRKAPIWQADLHGEDTLRNGTVFAIHPTEDIALVAFISSHAIETVTLDKRQPRFGERVWTVGYPAAQGIHLSMGLVSAPDRSSAPIFFGNSGGPVIDSGGRVIAVARALTLGQLGPAVVPIPHMMWMIPIFEISDWLTQYHIPT